jgi:hypothetical protein
MGQWVIIIKRVKDLMQEALMTLETQRKIKEFNLLISLRHQRLPRLLR